MRVLVDGSWRSVAEVYALLNHPGHADQSSHGRKKGAAKPKGSPADLHAEAAIRKTFDYHDPVTGMTAKVTSISGGDPSMTTIVTLSITDRDGKEVGEGFRSIRAADQAKVVHASITLKPHVQGQGFMTRYNQQVEQSYRDHGIKQIELFAGAGNGATGGYAWARAGYDFASPAARGHIARAATEFARRPGTSAKVKAEVKRVAANPKASPADFAMIGHTAGAASWPGKDMLLGLDTGWEGVKTL